MGKSKEETIADMERAANEAANDLVEILSPEAITPVANWIKQWYRRAGYKRLCRILLEYSD